MKRVVNYNDSYFENRLENTLAVDNLDFWNLLSDFDKAHPEADLTVIFNVRPGRMAGRYVEVLEFRCSRKEWEERVSEIYRRHYHPEPLTLRDNLLREPTDEEIHSVGCKS